MFCDCERWLLHLTEIPVGRWVARTAVSTLFTFCPPCPPERNDSLKYITPGGNVVYGGGGIIPDVFVPIDTAGVTDLLIQINRQALTVKYASEAADKYRSELRDVASLDELNALLDSMDLESGFLAYLRLKGVTVDMEQWRVSRQFVLTRLRALVGRYSSLDDNAFYPILAEIDNVIQAAAE